MIFVHKQVSVLRCPETLQVSAAVTWMGCSPEPCGYFSWMVTQGFSRGAECRVLFSTDKSMAFLLRQTCPMGTDARAGQRLIWHKQHPARGLKSVLGLIHWLHEAGRSSKAGPGPTSMEGWRRWGWGAGRARNSVFLSKNNALGAWAGFPAWWLQHLQSHP